MIKRLFLVRDFNSKSGSFGAKFCWVLASQIVTFKEWSKFNLLTCSLHDFRDKRASVHFLLSLAKRYEKWNDCSTSHYCFPIFIVDCSQLHFRQQIMFIFAILIDIKKNYFFGIFFLFIMFHHLIFVVYLIVFCNGFLTMLLTMQRWFSRK